jgi:hypothetical protein
MRQVITSKQEFEDEVHGSDGGMLLLFRSNSSSRSDVDGYAEEAEDKCGDDYPVCTIDIDGVKLSDADVAKYQQGVTVICCTVLVNDSVVYKKVNPYRVELRLEIRC